MSGVRSPTLSWSRRPRARVRKSSSHKVSSTPADQSVAVVQGVVEVCKIAGVSPGDIDLVLHGTTVATNMVIERNGADVGMITTRGFRDILHMARHKRPHNFSLQFDVPWQSKPLVKRRNRLVVDERLRAADRGGRGAACARSGRSGGASCSAKRGLESVVICFLFSFLNSEHEAAGRDVVKRVIPDAFVCCSHEVVNIIREYERFSSTAMNAYIGPTRRALSPASRRAPSRERRRGQGAHHAVERRHLHGREFVAALRSGCCCPDRQAASSAGAGPAKSQQDQERHHHRHWRHIGRHLGDPERRAAHQESARHRGCPSSGAGADDRHRRHRRRRRLDRLSRSGRGVPRRSAIGRRLAGPGMLRQGRQGARRNRRAGRARVGSIPSIFSAAI